MANASVNDVITESSAERSLEAQMITRSQTKRNAENLRLEDEDISFRTPKPIENSDVFRRAFAKQEERIEMMRADSLRRDTQFMELIQDLGSKLEILSESTRLNSTAINDSARLRVNSQSTIQGQQSSERLSSVDIPVTQNTGHNINGTIPQRGESEPLREMERPYGPPPMINHNAPNHFGFGQQREPIGNNTFPYNRDYRNRSPRDQSHNRTMHRVVFDTIQLNGTEEVSIDSLPASVIDVKSTRPGKPLMMSGGIILPDRIPSGTTMKINSILLEHENEYYKGKATALQYLKDAILALHPNWNVIGDEVTHLDVSNTSILNSGGDQTKLAMDMVKRHQIPSDVYFDGLNDLDDYFETCDSYMIGLPTEVKAIMLRRGFKGEALSIFKELPSHLAFDDVSIKEHFRSYYAKSQSTRYKDKFENMLLKAGMSYSWFAHNLRSAYIADNPTTIHRLVEKVVKVHFLRKIPKGSFDHISGYYDMDMLSIAETLDKSKAYKKIVYTNTNVPTAKVMVASGDSSSKGDNYFPSDKRNFRNHSSDGRGHSGDRRNYSGERYNSSRDRRDNSSRDRRDNSSRERRDTSQDRYNRPRNDQRYSNNTNRNQSNGSKNYSNDQRNHSSGYRDHSGDRRNSPRNRRDYSPVNRSRDGSRDRSRDRSRDLSRDRSPSNRNFNSYRDHSPQRNSDRTATKYSGNSPTRFDSNSNNSKNYRSSTGSSPQRMDRNSRGSSPQRPRDFTCWFCGKKGHFAADCWSKVQKKLYGVMHTIGDDNTKTTLDTDVSSGSLNA